MRPTVLVALLALAATGPGLAQRSTATGCERPVPAGVAVLPSDPEFDPWASPWVFSADGDVATALPSIRRAGERLNVRLDDGTSAALRVERGAPGAEDFEASIMAASGAVVSRVRFSAPYGSFSLVPVDLVDGPGDELILVSEAARAAPRLGADLRILRTAGGGSRDLVAPGSRVGGRVGSYHIACTSWRTDLLVDLAKPVPRRIRLRGRAWYHPPCCLDSSEDAATLRTIVAGQELRFINGQYSLR